ncbi:MAG: flagellar biosynthesis protein FlgA [Deltaproteobacteria bacterium]|nr:MAG: flagellar biosynthesis protein FlgA [Deltaproteobacteria bacterium]
MGRGEIAGNRLLLVGILMVLVSCDTAEAVRIKDIASIKGIRSNQLVGYGLVVGLDGTGDKSGAAFTRQSLGNLMERMGVSVGQDQLNVANVAAVMVTATLPPFARIGDRLDVVASSVGDAKSLGGGTLLITPLRGVDNTVYAVAQGALSIGGSGGEGGGGGKVKNHLLVGRISGGASVEREIPFELNAKKNLTLSLNRPDFTTVTRVADSIDAVMGEGTAFAKDAGTIELQVPESLQGQVPRFIAGIERLDISPDTAARIVVNEKTGTVVIGENVRISTVAVTHGNLTITVRESQEISQPLPLSDGETAATTETDVSIEEERMPVMLLPEGSTIKDLVKALNAIGVSPRDLISIFQSIKAAGALQAELEVI